MDLVACEAPLDNSFQKERRELVSKGSLGRRRKPSRSNLKLILSPATGQQDIDVFQNTQEFDFDSSFVQEKVSPTKHLKESVLDNYRERATIESPLSGEDFPENALSNVYRNHREVAKSFSQVYNVKCIDINGNSQQNNIPSSNNRQSIGFESRFRSRQQIPKTEVNSIDYSQTSVIENHQKVTICNNQANTKLSNGFSSAKSKNCDSGGGALKTQKITQSKKYLQRNRQESVVTSKNLQNIITFTNHRQIAASIPVQPKNPDLPNGKQDYSLKINNEPSLPRTSKVASLVDEAWQFSIEAKLKRKNSDVQGRSAVLIQTWERRTQSESCSKLRRDSITLAKNRFSGKENCDAKTAAMPDSYICMKYKGSLQNGDCSENGEMVPKVRDIKPGETMVFRNSDDSQGRIQLPHSSNGGISTNGNAASQEPEWISLSRKLCAKFVEGHIEAFSPDSYVHEEAVGVGEEHSPSLLSRKNHSGSIPSTNAELQKKKVIPTTTPSPETHANEEPPWVHLSRKLCNKFIEEHIEYPTITNGHFVEVPELVEPNGDVRIIEKVGKSTGHKSKQKKECEPEWISLSKKLRAKFIESHIDDPDTIALDNQLNAFDPDETGSETLSHSSQDTAVSKLTAVPPEPAQCRDHSGKNGTLEENAKFEKNEHCSGSKDPLFADEKECCWEYQEMEFDQESNSGNFQEFEYYNQPVQEVTVHRRPLPEDDSNKFVDRVTFANSYTSQNPECFNNDVIFAPCFTNNESVSDRPRQNKLITVQFIAHSEKEESRNSDYRVKIPHNNDNNKNDSYSPYEEAHYQTTEDKRQNFEERLTRNDFRSKSLDNLCDSLENENLENSGKRKSFSSADGYDSVENFSSVDFKDATKESLNEDEIFVDDGDIEPISASADSETNANVCCTCICDDSLIASENSILCTDDMYSEEIKEEFYEKQEKESSSEDEVFEYLPKNTNKTLTSPEAESIENIPPRLDIEMEGKFNNLQTSKDTFTKNGQSSKTVNGKNLKCNGVIPNSVYNSFPEGEMSAPTYNQTDKNMKVDSKQPMKKGMSKWVTMSKSDQNINKQEYSNLHSFTEKKEKCEIKTPEHETESKFKVKNSNWNNKINQNETASSSKSKSSLENDTAKAGTEPLKDFNRMNGYINQNNNDSPKNSDLKSKCKSLCDISFMRNSSNDGNSLSHHESIGDLCSSRTQTPAHPKIEFQHFESDSEIPLCAKLVSNHVKRASRNIPSATPSNRTESPCPSETSHVYEDMFKETPSGPSDSEASSWTVMKNNTYYVNGRSSSMNDLDFSDSCSMSVKCDYASSSESSTLQSRHSSYASSSFYVNLRDYDSHMLEPNLNKTKKNNEKSNNNGLISNVGKSNPPTPESLRHLFTSPLTSMHVPPNRNARFLNRMPSDPQSHYYSTASVTSSAFKHGFAPTPPKPKKAERSSSVKIKDIAHGIILTFKRLQNHSKHLNLSSAQQVDVSHLAEAKGNSELGKAKKKQKDFKYKSDDKDLWTENGRNDSDSGFMSDAQRAKARRTSSDVTGFKSNSDLFKKKDKISKKNSNREKAKKSKNKDSEPRTVPTVSRKVQQMADGTLYLVTTVSGDSNLPGVYSDSPDTSSELSGHRPFKYTGESNC